jgi:hypothetical protein
MKCASHSSPEAALAVALAASGILLIVWLSHLTYAVVSTVSFLGRLVLLSYELRGTALLLIRTDRSPRPWQLRVSGPGPIRICGIAAGQS